MTAFLISFFVLGLSLSRFNVLAAAVATAISISISFVYTLMNGWTLAQAILLNLILALVLQVGYLVGQALPPLKR